MNNKKLLITLLAIIVFTTLIVFVAKYVNTMSSDADIDATIKEIDNIDTTYMDEFADFGVELIGESNDKTNPEDKKEAQEIIDNLLKEDLNVQSEEEYNIDFGNL